MTTFAHSVKIGRELFRKAPRDYADQFWAFVREILQNSLDCGSTKIDIRIVQMAELDQTRVIVENNGEVMTHEILVDKLLSLGSSGKDFRAGAVGGFGKAKEILYFTHLEYEIHSGSWHVEGSGAGYNIEMSDECRHGTKSRVVWEGLHAERLIGQFERFIRMSHRPDCQFTVNGNVIESRLGRGRFKRVLTHIEKGDWAEVRIAGNEPNLVVVRVNGTPMFTARSEYKRTVILELYGASVDTLTSNRDGLKYPFSSVLQEFLTTLAVDKKSALRDYEPTYHRYGGARVRYREAVAEPAAVCVVDTGVPLAAALVSSCAGINDHVQARHEEPVNILQFEFVLKNCFAKRAVPREFDPGSNHFSDHAHWLIKSWAKCLLELHRTFHIRDAFSVGFILAEDLAAETECGGYGRLYLVNPLVFSKRGYRRRFPKSQRHELIAMAAHEFVHGAFELNRHDEEYAGKLTDVFAAVLKNQRAFARHVK